MRAAGASPMFYGMSIVSGEVVAKVLGDQAEAWRSRRWSPTPGPGRAGPQTYQHTLQQAKAEPSYYSFEGWLNAQVMIEALRTGRELTRARLLTAMRAFKMRLAGMDLDFSAEGIAASRFVELVQVRYDGHFVR